MFGCRCLTYQGSKINHGSKPRSLNQHSSKLWQREKKPKTIMDHLLLLGYLVADDDLWTFGGENMDVEEVEPERRRQILESVISFFFVLPRCQQTRPASFLRKVWSHLVLPSSNDTPFMSDRMGERKQGQGSICLGPLPFSDGLLRFPINYKVFPIFIQSLLPSLACWPIHQTCLIINFYPDYAHNYYAQRFPTGVTLAPPAALFLSVHSLWDTNLFSLTFLPAIELNTSLVFYHPPTLRIYIMVDLVIFSNHLMSIYHIISIFNSTLISLHFMSNLF